MLIIEKTNNGRTIVVLKRDWHPGRISKAYEPPLKDYMTDSSIRLQGYLLKHAKQQRAQAI